MAATAAPGDTRPALRVVPGGSGDLLHPAGRETARAAGLRYVSDERPGIRRRRCGRGWSYLGPDGATVRDERTLRRIRSLVIPPAWRDVWICPIPHGHIQATGRDEKGRKQYRYHPRWHEVRDATKYDRMIQFGEALPRIRRRVDEDLSRRGLPREKVLATVVRLLEETLIRVGNDEYARKNESFGLTTLREEHVDVQGSTVRFHFRGKSGKECDADLRDRRVSQVVRKLQELPGQELFQYHDDDGQIRDVASSDVNEYLREISGQDFTAKDFRTWAGTLLAFRELCGAEPCETKTAAKKRVATAIKNVASRLNNTPAVCRKCYVHPAVLETYLDEAKRALLTECPAPEIVDEVEALKDDEARVLGFLKEIARTAGRPARRRRAA
ncbi:MAG: DNA topoisomerase IB [Armatimonadota bacterium]